MSEEEKAFRCKICKAEFDDLFWAEKHIEDEHSQDQIERLPKSNLPCPYTYVSMTSSFGGEKKCKFTFGHKGEHQYIEYQAQIQQPQRFYSGWRKL